MANSPLINYTKLSPNCTKPRNHAIDVITIHCVAGNCSVETVGDIFADSSRQASSNYGVGADGRVGLYVDEANRSWCTSSASNDNRAVTIEVANDGNASSGWHVSDKALSALINLVADVCKRNGIKKLLWKNDKTLIGQVDKQNMTVHQWFKNKDCPGAYLLSKHGYIADEVNKRLEANAVTPLMGKAVIAAETLAAFLLSKNPAPKLNGVDAAGLAKLYISEGDAEGIRGDIAFCQSLLETGYWKFGKDVKPEQNNFAGIGTTGGGVAGASFPSAQIGIRAQIQHLKAYATAAPLAQTCVDPRYGLVSPKGKSPTVEGLSGAWAVDGNYAKQILNAYNAVVAFKPNSTVTDDSTFTPYAVRVNVSALNVREAPGVNERVVKVLLNDKNVYTITEETDGPGATKWCKLKSGIGWVSKDYLTKT